MAGCGSPVWTSRTRVPVWSAVRVMLTVLLPGGIWGLFSNPQVKTTRWGGWISGDGPGAVAVWFRTPGWVPPHRGSRVARWPSHRSCRAGSVKKPKTTSGGAWTWISWCMADIGWITGHSYILYGPLALGTTTVVYEGVPNYPDGERPWPIAE